MRSTSQPEHSERFQKSEISGIACAERRENTSNSLLSQPAVATNQLSSPCHPFCFHSASLSPQAFHLPAPFTPHLSRHGPSILLTLSVFYRPALGLPRVTVHYHYRLQVASRVAVYKRNVPVKRDHLTGLFVFLFFTKSLVAFRTRKQNATNK